MAVLFQYPSHAEPIAVSDNLSASPDGLKSDTVDLIRPRPRRIEGGTFMPPLSGDETVQIDKFTVATELPTRRKVGRHSGVSVLPLEPYPATPIDDWRRPSERPRNPVRWPTHGGSVSPVASYFPVVAALEWGHQSERPRPAVPRRPGGVATAPLEPSLIVEQALAWLRASERPRAAVRRCFEGLNGQPLEPSITTSQALDWLRLSERPRNPIPPRQYQSLAEPVEPSVRVEQALAWLRNSERPRNPIPSRQYHTYTAPLEPGLIVEQALSWLASAAMQSRHRRTTPITPTESVIEVVVDLLSLSWLRDSEYPRLARRQKLAPAAPSLDPFPVALPIGWEWLPAVLYPKPGATPWNLPDQGEGPVSPVTSAEMRIDNRNVTGRVMATISVSGG